MGWAVAGIGVVAAVFVLIAADLWLESSSDHRSRS